MHRLPFDSTSARVSSSAALKRNVSNTFRYPQSNNRHEVFLNNSSSSSITEDESTVKGKTIDETLPENNNGLGESDKRKNTLVNGRHLSMNNQATKKDIGGPMIQELIQSNMDLK